MTNKIIRLIKSLTEKPLSNEIMNTEGGLYQNTDGYTFYSSDPQQFNITPMSQSCSNCICTTTNEESASKLKPSDQDYYLKIFVDD